jgi:hypothetical protein
MGIDIRQSRRGKHDRCKYYKASYVDKMKLTQDAVTQGVFYAEGFSDDETDTVNNGTMQSARTMLTITTLDTVSDLEQNDYVEIDGTLHLVMSVGRKGIGETEQFNRRPALSTVIQLRR